MFYGIGVGVGDDYELVDMLSIVIVGNSSSYIKNNRIITKRGYENKEKGDYNEKV